MNGCFLLFTPYNYFDGFFFLMFLYTEIDKLFNLECILYFVHENLYCVLKYFSYCFHFYKKIICSNSPSQLPTKQCIIFRIYDIFYESQKQFLPYIQFYSKVFSKLKRTLFQVREYLVLEMSFIIISVRMRKRPNASIHRHIYNLFEFR